MNNPRKYLSSEEFDLMFNDELDKYYEGLELDYQYENYLLEKEAMETDYQYCK